MQDDDQNETDAPRSQKYDNERCNNDWPQFEYCSLDEADRQEECRSRASDERILIIVENVNGKRGSTRASISAPSSFTIGVIFGVVFGAAGALAANHYVVGIINASL
jgi:hypothetical protein